ncbi:MAG: hypothetical protein WCB51_10425 [Candidatus Dormiibacterota bacterium]
MAAGRRDARAAVRAFDPVDLARMESAAWIGYYRREWGRVLAASIGLVRCGFQLPWPQTLWGAWLVLRANQLWAPYPGNDPDGARRLMKGFYDLAGGGEGFDSMKAARLEVEWWRVHRELQHQDGGDTAALGEAVAALYAYTYDTPIAGVRESGELRADAMRICDRWVAHGCDMEDPLVADMRRTLLRSYRSLKAAVT